MHEWKQECRHLETRGGKCVHHDGVCCTNEYPGGCLPIIEQCMTAGIRMAPDPKDKDKQIEQQVACARIIGGEAENLCAAYINPAAIWNARKCPLAGHAVTAEEEKKKINPLKASKRAAKGKKG